MNEQEARALAGLGATIQNEGGKWYRYTDGLREELKAVKTEPRKRAKTEKRTLVGDSKPFVDGMKELA